MLENIGENPRTWFQFWHIGVGLLEIFFQVKYFLATWIHHYFQVCCQDSRFDLTNQCKDRFEKLFFLFQDIWYAGGFVLCAMFKNIFANISALSISLFKPKFEIFELHQNQFIREIDSILLQNCLNRPVQKKCQNIGVQQILIQ